MKKGVLRIAAIVLFAAVVFINVSHGHVKAFQGDESEAAADVSIIDGDGVLEVPTGDDLYNSPTKDNIGSLGAGAGAPTIASTEAVEVAEADTTSYSDFDEDGINNDEAVVDEADEAYMDDTVKNTIAEADSEAVLPDADTEDAEDEIKEDSEVLAGRSEPKTAGRDVPIVVLAMAALLADLLIVLLENARGMTEADKVDAIKKIKMKVRSNDRFSHIKAYVEIFALLFYYHLIGKNLRQNRKYA